MADSVPWNDLPDVALLYIYGDLCNSDRLNVACTCKNWNRIFFSSALWRERRVVFNPIYPERRAELEKKFIDKFGHSLCKLVLCIGQPSFKSCMTISKAVDSYLKHICGRNDINLREIELENLHFEQNWHFILSRNRLTSALCRMLRKQKCLQSVYVSGARMRIFDGCRVLEAVGKGFTGRTVANLYLEDFFEINVVPFRQARFVSAMSKFRALEHLHINYRYISTDILRNFTNNLSHCLKTISMILDGDVRGIEIPSEVWYEFSSRCPRVKVNIYLCTTILRGNDLRSAFVREMPLHECYLTSYSRLDETEERLGILLRHLGNLYHNTLENFAMLFERHERIDFELLYMLGKCRALKDVCLQCRLGAVTVIDIMKLLHDGRLVLRGINLTIPGLSNEEWAWIEEVKPSLIPNSLEFVHIGPNEFGSSIGGSTSTANESEEDPEVVVMAENYAVNAGNAVPEVEIAEAENAVLYVSDDEGSASEHEDEGDGGYLM